MSKEQGMDTRCVHTGELDDHQGSPHTPIYNSTTFAFKNTADLLDVVEGRCPGNLYTRYGLNPPSLGGVESLVTRTVTTTRHGLTPEERSRRGISDALIRLSIGLEAPEDLIADLEQALE